MRCAFLVMMVAMLPMGCGVGAVGADRSVVPAPEPEAAAPDGDGLPDDAVEGWTRTSPEQWAEEVWELLDTSCAMLVIAVNSVHYFAVQADVDQDDRWLPAMRRMRAEIDSWLRSVERLRQAPDHRERWRALLALQDSTMEMTQALYRLEETADIVDVDDLTVGHAIFLDSIRQLRMVIERARDAVFEATMRYSTIVDV